MSRNSLIIAAVSLAALGCGQNNLASKISPDAPSASDALGVDTVACSDVGKVAEPYVVDLRGTDRSHLEALMSEGVAVVRYDCDGLELLKGCGVASGSQSPYTFVGISMKQDQLQIETVDQLRANLPASAVQLEGELSSGAAIDVGLVMVGRRSTPFEQVSLQDLEGPGCDGATHFVRSAIVGAFAVDKGTQGTVRAAAEIFGAGAEAGSASSRKVANRDGKPEDCEKVRPGDRTMPDFCRSAIAVELYPILDEPPPVMADGQTESEQQDKAVVGKCPEGYVRSDGLCKPPSQARAFACKPGKRDECKEQCDAGNPESCYNLALLTRDDSRQQLLEKACNHPDGPGAACRSAAFTFNRKETRNLERYEQYLVLGCDRGDAGSCSQLGNALMSGFSLDKDVPRGVKLLERSCGMGDRYSCSSLGMKLIMGKHDVDRGLTMLDAACTRGVVQDCTSLANLYRHGKASGKRDGKQALSYYDKACDLNSGRACTDAGTLLAEGKHGVKTNKKRAKSYFMRGCPEPAPPGRKHKSGPAALNADSCRALAAMVKKNSAKEAERYLERACDPSGFMHLGCADLATLYMRGGKGMKKDRARGEALLRESCDGKGMGASQSCEALGALLEKQDRGIARGFYEAKCDGGKRRSMCEAAERLGG